MVEKINKWFIATKPNTGDIFNLEGLTVHEPPNGYYQADPFIIKWNGVNYVFHELYDYQKGVIAYSILNNALSEPKTVINLDTHISFPAIFVEENNVYMTFENALGGELAIYQAIDFPDKWEKIQVVAKGRFDDPVIYKQGRYYIYTVEGDNNLRIFSAESLTGSWLLSYAETIQHSRPAGNIFQHQGKTLRPTQDSVPIYGKRIIIKDQKTGSEYRTIEPDWHPNLTGTHTFNFNEDYIVLDGRIKL